MASTSIAVGNGIASVGAGAGAPTIGIAATATARSLTMDADDQESGSPDASRRPTEDVPTHAAPPDDRTWRAPGRRDSGVLRAAQLEVGTRIGRYEILGLLGVGGMGRVYGAHDATLDRDVAIKALAGAFRDDSASLRRLEREAKVLAALSHPNVAAIYGFEELDGDLYLVLEKVDGGTLADRLGRGAVPPREAITIAVQIAEGLAEAHAKGVIHRDLKPSNVMLGSGGRVKLVDFGLAKSMAARSSGSEPNLTTAAGSILGTAPYMSPEQIRGEELDARTDVWAFGCLLYETLVGRPAFWAATPPEVLAAALRDEPDLAPLEGCGSPALARLVRRCLTKERTLRPQHIDDLALELVEIGSALDHPSLQVEAAVGPPPRSRRRAFGPLVAAGALLVVAALGFLLGRAGPAPTAPRALALSLELPRGLSFANSFAAPFALAPDGSRVVLTVTDASGTRLVARSLDDAAVLPIASSDDGWQPAVSPDGTAVAFFADRKLLRSPLGEGASLPLAELGTNPRGAAWLPNGSIVVASSQTSGLSSVPDAGGGTVTELTELDSAGGEHSHRWPEALPGGEWLLFTVGLEGRSYDEARIDAVSVRTRERRTVLVGGSYPRYLPGGRLLFVRGGRVYAVSFDPRTLEVEGAPEVVIPGVRYDSQNGSAHLAVSGSGELVYGPGLPSSPETYLSWLLPKGGFERLTETPRQFRDPRLSPDGTRVAVVVGRYAESDLRVLEQDGTLTQLSFGLSPHRPTWTPDGKRITVATEADGRWRLVSLAADGKGEASVLLEGDSRMYPSAWTPDGRSLVYQVQHAARGWDLRILELGADGRPSGQPRVLAATPFHETNAVVSPDGRWVAYESDEVDGLVQLYVRSLPDGGTKIRATLAGARWPVWGVDASLYYWDTAERRLMAARTREESGHLLVEVGEPVVEEPVRGVMISVTGARFDIDRVGGRVLVLETDATGDGPLLRQPIVLLGWGDRWRGASP